MRDESKAKYDFAGRIAVVTGGARGIGAEVMRQLRAAGATAVSWDLGEADDGAASLRVDVTDRVAVETAAARTAQRWGGIDILVNSAGFAGSTVPLDACDPVDKSWAFKDGVFPDSFETELGHGGVLYRSAMLDLRAAPYDGCIRSRWTQLRATTNGCGFDRRFSCKSHSHSRPSWSSRPC